MSIRSVLRHRATVRRVVSGTSYSTVATGIPVLLDTQGFEVIPNTATTAAQQNEARKFGAVYCAAEADIRPADRLQVKVPGRPVVTVEVQPEPSYVDTPTGVSHRELRVKGVPGP